MFEYFLILFFLAFGVFHYDLKGNKYFKNLYYFITFLLFVLLCGLRYRVGGDSLLYENYYHFFPKIGDYLDYLENDNFFGYQPLWLLLVAACKSINPDYYFYQFIHSIIFNSVFFWFIKKKSSKPFTVLLIFFCSLIYLYFGYEIQREILAICCFLIGYESFTKNKWFTYYICAILAFLFHISGIILLILPLFKLIHFNKKLITVVLIVSIPLILAKTFFYDFLSLLLFTESMQKKGAGYSETEFSISGILLFYFIRVVLFLPFLFYYAKVKFEKMDWLFSAFLFTSVLSQVMVGFDRLINYLYIPFIVVIVEFIYDKELVFANIIREKIIKLGLYAGIFFVIGIKLFLGNFGSTMYYSIFFPYENTFDRKENKMRETYLIKLWSQ